MCSSPNQSPNQEQERSDNCELGELKVLMTWQDIYEAIGKLTLEQRSQMAQFVLPTLDCDEVQEFMPCVSMATVKQFGFYRCRSAYDNKYHAEDVVMLIDGNMFGKDGEIAVEFKLDDDGYGTHERKIFGDDGPTAIEDQMSPEALAHWRHKRGLDLALIDDAIGPTDDCQTGTGRKDAIKNAMSNSFDGAGWSLPVEQKEAANAYFNKEKATVRHRIATAFSYVINFFRC